MSLRIAIAIILAVAACQPAAPRPHETGAAPQRIVSRIVLADEILWELGPEVHRRVASVSVMADDPRYSGVRNKWPAHVARTTGSGEALVALSPDLVIIGSFTNGDVRALLRGAGIETLAIDRLNGFEDFRFNVRAIAAAVHAPREGEALLARFDAGLAALHRDPGAEPATVVSWSEGIVAGAGTTFDDATSWIGIRNLPALRGVRSHKKIALEQMVAWDPEVIVIGCEPERCAEASAKFGDRLGIRGTRAGKRGNIIAIEAHTLHSTGLEMLELVRSLRSLTVH